MPRNYSKAAKTNLNAVSAADPMPVLIEIHHASFSEPARLVADTDDLVHQGDLYTALPVEVSLPEEGEGRAPQARLVLDNVGRVLTEAIDNTRGLEGGFCRILQVMRSHPDHVEWQTDLDVMQARVDQQVAELVLGYEDFLNKAAVTVYYTPETSPGLF
ncbi:DUF1833 domain-containing protein [Parasalinivibrio latis]|uniref:DUF1833 family protein n=1 Tax=Parasalinivibrio latis TaxID=2952610 RepID=UPI0030E0D07C